MKAFFVVRELRKRLDSLEAWLPLFFRACDEADRYDCEQLVGAVVLAGVLEVDPSTVDPSGQRTRVVRFANHLVRVRFDLSEPAWTEALGRAVRSASKVLK